MNDLISITPMTSELAKQYYMEFIPDPDLFQDKSKYQPFQYSEDFCDALIQRYAAMGRVFMAVMLNDKPIGELVLKNINYETKTCELGISMINDNYKNYGYGTKAEELILAFAFHKMGMETVFADTLTGNLRSQHVLSKVGFRETHRNDHFVYYRCDHPD